MNGPEESFAPHVILPSQFYSRNHRTDVATPVRRLMLAVLTDALDCLSGRAIDARGSARQREARRAAEWVALDSDMYLFSFNSVCEALGIDPDALREGLKTWHVTDRRLAARFHFVPRRTRVTAHGAFARHRAATSQRLKSIAPRATAPIINPATQEPATGHFE
jgi:hypothetical protein